MFVWGLGLESRDPTRTLTAGTSKKQAVRAFQGIDSYMENI